jgi:hypothetical protein
MNARFLDWLTIAATEFSVRYGAAEKAFSAEIRCPLLSLFEKVEDILMNTTFTHQQSEKYCITLFHASVAQLKYEAATTIISELMPTLSGANLESFLVSRNVFHADPTGELV